jgi:hypothetical protein
MWLAAGRFYPVRLRTVLLAVLGSHVGLPLTGMSRKNFPMMTHAILRRLMVAYAAFFVWGAFSAAHLSTRASAAE